MILINYAQHSIIGHLSRYIYEWINIFDDIYNGDKYLYVYHQIKDYYLMNGIFMLKYQYQQQMVRIL